MIFEISGRDCRFRRCKARENRVTKRAALFLIERLYCTAQRTKSLVSLSMLASLSLTLAMSAD